METLLKQIRKRTDFKTPRAQEVFGIDQGRYSRIESGELTASPEVAEKIASYFKVPLSAIFAVGRYIAVPISGVSAAPDAGTPEEKQ